MINLVKRVKDDIGHIVDSEDNIARMILLEQAIDAAYEIDESVSRSYAFFDCVIAIFDYIRETSNQDLLERIPPLLDEISNKGAYSRAMSYKAVVYASFEREEEALEALRIAIETAVRIKDEFDRQDALLDAATSTMDISYLLQKKSLVDQALSFADQLTNGQKAYLLGYMSTILPEGEGKFLMNEAIKIVNEIQDPITKSKIYIELATLMSNLDNDKPVEE